MSVSEDTYTQLTRLFKGRKDKVYDFEILPRGFGPILHDGLSIGITKATLVQAFLVARRNFFGSLRNTGPGLPQAMKDGTAEITSQHQSDTLDDSSLLDTAVILLFDPEHLTACNYRKRHLLHILETSPDQRASAFISEVTFTTTLLRSPLHRHSKSPTLWHHRFWVMGRLFVQDESHSLDLVGSVLCQSGPRYAALSLLENTERIAQAELSVVLRSGERHPMNYYAFSYLRQFLGLLGLALEEQVPIIHSYGRNEKAQLHGISQAAVPRDEISISMRQVVEGPVMRDMHAWCLAHPGDTSGWSFLHFLMDIVGDSAAQGVTVEKTVQFARDVKWDGESLWAFIDNCVTSFGISLDSSSTPVKVARTADDGRDGSIESKSPH